MAKAAPKAAPKAAKKKVGTKLTKSGLITALADKIGEEVSRKHVKALIEGLTDILTAELKKNEVFVLPNVAKFVVAKRESRPEREGTNPFTGEKITIKARPATKVVKVRPVKALKDEIAKK